MGYDPTPRSSLLPARYMARPHTGLCSFRYVRYPGSRLRSGTPAAQAAFRLVLLGSPPDTVHGAALRGTDPSLLLTWVRRHTENPGAGIHPCCSGLQVQGTAISPTSAALPHTGQAAPIHAESSYLLSYIISRQLSISLFDFLKKGFTFYVWIAIIAVVMSSPAPAAGLMCMFRSAVSQSCGLLRRKPNSDMGA